MTTNSKRCSRCKTIKPIEAFHLNRSRSMGRACTCKECHNYHLAIIRRLHSEHQVSDGHLCPICWRSADQVTTPSSRTKTPWRLDHDNESELFGGFLCDGCNTGLGKFGESPERLMNAMVYLLDNASHFGRE